MKPFLFIGLLWIVLLQGCQEEGIKSSQETNLTAISKHGEEYEKGISPPTLDREGNGEQRYALLIGNSHYQSNLDDLTSPSHDVSDMKKLLESSGIWKVETLLNANHQKTEEAIDEFTNKYKNKILLFFYTGHATQIEGESYLLPVGQKFDKDSDVKYHSVKANQILDKFAEAESQLTIIILDACRNNALAKTKGSGTKGIAYLKFSPSVKDYLIMYGTRPGETAADQCGRNSCFTKHFLEAIKRYGRESIDDVFREVIANVSDETKGEQVPEHVGSSRVKFCMFGCTPKSPKPDKVPSPPPIHPPRPSSVCKELIKKVETGIPLTSRENRNFQSCSQQK